MAVKKPVPCSIYDLRGIQEWLDEMARQGLFLKQVNSRFERAEFEVGAPAPVRYRLDPVNRKGKTDDEHIALYAQMGWNYVDRAGRWYCIFSCDDPEAPELYTDPQSLALAMDSLVRRDIRNHLLTVLLFVLLIPLILFFPTPYSLKNLLLWENPRDLVMTIILFALLPFPFAFTFFDIRRILKIRNTLAHGLPLPAKKRWNRPPFWSWYIPFWVILYWLPRLILPSIGWEVCGLDEITPSHPWPAAAQIEQLGAYPLAEEPVTDGYVRLNDSPLAPVQEEINRHRVLDPHAPTNTDLHTTIRYIRASSPRLARWLYQMERDQEAKSLEARQSPPYAYRVTNLVPFAPRDWPGLDRLEAASYQWQEQESWTFAVLRGNDVLLVSYTGTARWEDCLPLFLEALDKEAAP